MIKILAAIGFSILWIVNGMTNDSTLMFSLFLFLSSHLDDIETKLRGE